MPRIAQLVVLDDEEAEIVTLRGGQERLFAHRAELGVRVLRTGDAAPPKKGCVL